MFERVRGHTVARPVSTSAGRANSEQTPSRSIASIEGSIIHAGYAVPQTERLYKLRHLFISGACPTRQQLLRDLEVSPATLKRDLAHLRDRMNMPIVWDRDRGGWRLDTAQPVVGTQYELPGLWFSAEEIHALLTMQHLLSHLDAGGLLGPHIAPLMQRLSELLGTGAPSRVEVARRIRVQTVGARRMHLPHFQAVGSALLRRHRLHIEYQGRGSGQRSAREVSPQRLIHYRDNWYLDAWCHARKALRSFSVDAIRAVRVMDAPAVDVADTELDAVLGAGYGIFAGKDVQWATLRFTPERARWVAAETWHPEQRGHWDADGCWVLTLPFSDPRELVMDVLRHVPEVEVVAPDALRDEVLRRMREAVRNRAASDE
jgi:predicted DNA-binding transcriptional regulator YafY